MYWTGDLGYLDDDGFFYFAGRGFEWLRVDGENFAAAPVERILARHPDVGRGRGLRRARRGGRRPGDGRRGRRARSGFDGAGLAAFLDEQADLGTKWSPRYVRVMDALPATATNKVLKRELRTEGWDVTDPVWWRPEPRRRLLPN